MGLSIRSELEYYRRSELGCRQSSELECRQSGLERRESGLECYRTGHSERCCRKERCSVECILVEGVLVCWEWGSTAGAAPGRERGELL